MRLDTVLTSVNINELYIDFIPNFVDHWKILFPEINIVIVLISDYIPEKFLQYEKYIILYSNKLKTIPSAFQSMCIRNLYPCLLENYGNILISDIDMMPMNRKYYETPIIDLSENKFVTYRDVLINIEEYPMCYNIANTKVWSDIFNIKSINELDNLLSAWYEESNYKITNPTLSGINNFDQKILFKYLQKFNLKTGNLIVLNDSMCSYHRLDRLRTNNILHTYVGDLFINNEINPIDIKNRKFSDYHSLRPYELYKIYNDKIKNSLKIV